MAALVTGRPLGGSTNGRRGTGRATASAILAAGVLVAACTTAPSGAPAGGSPTPGAASSGALPSSGASGLVSPSAGASGVAAACRTSDLAIRVVIEPGRHAAGSTYYPIVFTNKGSGPCALSGHPVVSLASASGGGPVGPPASPDGTAAVTVTLAPGDEAHAVLQVSNADVFPAQACGPVDAPHWLRVTPPGETAPTYVSFTIETKACSLGGQLAISAISAGSGG
jgi:hypothetical protein